MQVRTIAVGLLTTAYLMANYSVNAVKLYQQFISDSPVMAFGAALKTLSPSVAVMAGVESYNAALIIIAFLGVGMAIAGFIYPVMEYLAVNKVIIPLWGFVTGNSQIADSRAASGQFKSDKSFKEGIAANNY